MVRLIPRLDIKGPNLVKGIQFEGLRVLGKPEHFAELYYQAGADELLYIDAVASLYGRNSLVDFIKRTAKDVFIPLAVGGGLRTLDDIRAVLRAGADKVSLNTAAIARPDLIREAAESFGSSTVVVSIEAKLQESGKYEAYVDYGRQPTGVEVVEWAERAVALGAGELMITAIDREGTGKGFDLELTRLVSSAVSVPVIAAGGAGSAADIEQAVREGGSSAVSVASLFHYAFLDRAVSLNGDYREEGNVEFLKTQTGKKKLQPTSIVDVKQYLSGRGIDCRLI